MGECERLFEVLTRLRQGEQFEIEFPHPQVPDEQPLAMANLFRKVEPLPHHLQRLCVLTQAQIAQPQHIERISFARALPDLTSDLERALTVWKQLSETGDSRSQSLNPIQPNSTTGQLCQG